MDVATVNVSIPGVEEATEMPLIGGMIGNFFGGSKLGMVPGKWLDLALYTRQKPAGTSGNHAIPPGQNMGASLPLEPVPKPQPGGTAPDTKPEDVERQKPKGRLLLYWGCGEAVRPGQPKILDMATAGPMDFAKFFVGRYAPERGATSEPGRAIWPNERDRQRVPKDASLRGDHAISGEGVPPSLKFAIGERQDFMAPMEIAASGPIGGPTPLTWTSIPTAQGYFLQAMGFRQDGNEMIIWTSSEVQDTGWGLMTWLPNDFVRRMISEKVVLPASTTSCTIPKGVFEGVEGAMVNGIAYGEEQNLAHPPRPTDPKIAWEPIWAVKVRVKSVGMTPLGMEERAERRGARRGDERTPTGGAAAPKPASPVDEASEAMKGLRKLLPF